MVLYKKWCKTNRDEAKRKRYLTLEERPDGRAEIEGVLAETMRSHYDRLDRIADDVERLGYKKAANILQAALPQTRKGRSGDLGEILATEFVEDEVELRVSCHSLFLMLRGPAKRAAVNCSRR